MAKFKLLALTNANEGRDKEFNEWYDNTHLKDLLNMPAVKSATRFRLIDNKSWAYLSIYDLDCEDPREVVKDIEALVASGKMVISPAVSLDSALALLAQPL